MSRRTRPAVRPGWAGGLLTVALTAAVLAHPDDPKQRDIAPIYKGQGYRRGLDGGLDDPSGGFGSSGIELLAWLPIEEFVGGGTGAANDCWGYVSPSGREYAIIGLECGTGFVEITDPGLAQVVATIPGPCCVWRDIKVFGEHAYVVSECGTPGIQVIDLTQIDGGVVTHVRDVAGVGGASHNVALDPDSGYLYRTGGSGNGLIIYDLNADPSNPTLVAQWPDRYVHDAQVVTYTSGPYAGKQIAFCCSGFSGGYVETGLDILDVTNKQNIIALSRLLYPNGAYSHQGWLSEDRQHFYLNDELDENGSLPTTTFVIDVSDLSSPFTATTFTNGNSATGHNLYVRDELIFEANYHSGLRVFDATDPLNPVETAFFDTRPEDTGTGFNGLWGTYPFFPSGSFVGSDRQRGLLVWRLGQPLIGFDLPSGLPEHIVPSGGTTVQIEIIELQPGGLVPGTTALYVDTGEGFTSTPLVPLGGDLYEGVFPAADCPDEVRFFFGAEASDGVTRTSPEGAPSSPYIAAAAYGLPVPFDDDGETDPGWTVENIALEDGAWERGVPSGGGARNDPPTDADGSGQCWVTSNTPLHDLDGGPTRLISPPLDLTVVDGPIVSYALWLQQTDSDRLEVHVSNNDGQTWTLVESTFNTQGWEERSFALEDYLPPTTQVRLRFTASDNPNNSITEAGVDAVRASGFECDAPCTGDLTGPNAGDPPDGAIDVFDLLALLANFGTAGPVGDITGPNPGDPPDGVVDVFDLLELLTVFGQSCPSP